MFTVSTSGVLDLFAVRHSLRTASRRRARPALPLASPPHPSRAPQRTPARHDGMRALWRLALAEEGRALLSRLPPPASPKRWLDEPNAEPEAEAEPKEEPDALCSAGLVRAWLGLGG